MCQIDRKNYLFPYPSGIGISYNQDLHPLLCQMVAEILKPNKSEISANKFWHVRVKLTEKK